jgi:L-alanine-DL-glutamate epimerase-like enolase superfamily enzyme
VKAYASTGELRSPEQRVDDAQRLRQEGFRALKLRFHSHEPRHDLRVLEAVRKAVGDGMDIMVDANYGWNIAPDRAVQRWDLRTAISMARAMEELGVYWLEEPLYCYDYDGLADLRRQVNLRIAGGELNQGLHEFLVLLDGNCLDKLQPDVCLAGGTAMARKVATLCEARGKGFSPHTWTNGIGLLHNLQLACGVPNCDVLEYPYEAPGWVPDARDALLLDPPRPVAGVLAVPARPGIGCELDPDALGRFGRKLAG